MQPSFRRTDLIIAMFLSASILMYSFRQVSFPTAPAANNAIAASIISPQPESAVESSLRSYYVHHLHYPDSCRQRAQQADILFSVDISKNKAPVFKSYPVARAPLFEKLKTIQVIAYAAKNSQIHPIDPAAEKAFVQEVEQRTAKIPMNTYSVGRCYFLIKFILENPR